MLSYLPSERSISSSTTPSVVFDLGSDVSIGSFALASHSAVSGDTWRIRADTTLAKLSPTPTTPEYDSGSQNLVPTGSYETTASAWSYKTSFITTTAITVRYVRIDFSVSVGFEAGVSLFDKLIQPSRNLQLVHKIPSFKERAQSKEAHSGALYTIKNPRRRTARFKVILEDRDEFYDDFWELERTHGSSEPFVFIYQPSQDDVIRGSMYCVLSRAQDMSVPNYQIWETDITLKEAT
jgi:hypothetical protein